MWKSKKIKHSDDLYIIYSTQSPSKIHRIIRGKTETQDYLTTISQHPDHQPPQPLMYDVETRVFEERLSPTQKQELTRQIRNYSPEEIAEDYNRLVAIGCEAKNKSVYVNTGNKVVDHFTFVERLNTLGRNKMTFFEFWENREHFFNKPNLKSLNQKLQQERPYESEYTRTYNIYRLYYGSVSIFKPLLAMEYYCRYQPTAVLDFTMGWGGRLVGACALNIPKYIGIDNNARLEPHYRDLTAFLSTRTETKPRLLFQDALEVDYSKLTYDMVFTSPPYYNIEKYNNMKTYKSKEDWDELFYFPLFYLTYKHLKKGGVYCLNISSEIYERVCVPLFGNADETFPMKKQSRHNKKTTEQKHMNTEYVYVWKKDI